MVASTVYKQEIAGFQSRLGGNPFNPRWPLTCTHQFTGTFDFNREAEVKPTEQGSRKRTLSFPTLHRILCIGFWTTEGLACQKSDGTQHSASVVFTRESRLHISTVFLLEKLSDIDLDTSLPAWDDSEFGGDDAKCMVFNSVQVEEEGGCFVVSLWVLRKRGVGGVDVFSRSGPGHAYRKRGKVRRYCKHWRRGNKRRRHHRVSRRKNLARRRGRAIGRRGCVGWGSKPGDEVDQDDQVYLWGVQQLALARFD